jgi:AraC-like DNA-binding protein
MQYATHRPGPPLSRYVDHLWFFEGYMPPHTKEKLLPNGVMELVIDLHDGPKRLHNQGQRNIEHDYRGAWLSGMQTDFLVIGVVRGSSMMGVHFRTLGARAFFRLPMEELAGKVVTLEDLIGPQARQLRERLLEAPAPQAKLRILERFLAFRLSNCGEDSCRSERLVNHVIERLRRPDGPLLVEQLAAEAGVTRRHLVRLFQDQVGMAPKALARVLRFQRVIETVETRGAAAISWTGLAYNCGYYDQAHFVQDFRAFAGIKPSGYLIQRGDYRNWIVV